MVAWHDLTDDWSWMKLPDRNLDGHPLGVRVPSEAPGGRGHGNASVVPGGEAAGFLPEKSMSWKRMGDIYGTWHMRHSGPKNRTNPFKLYLFHFSFPKTSKYCMTPFWTENWKRSSYEPSKLWRHTANTICIHQSAHFPSYNGGGSGNSSSSSKQWGRHQA